MLPTRHSKSYLVSNMKCYHCESELIWGGDHDIDDNEPEDNSEGIVTNLSCSNEECNTHVEEYHYFDDDEVE